MNVFTGPFHIKQSHFRGKTTEEPNMFFRFSTNWRTMDCLTSEMHKFTIKQEKTRMFPFVDLIRT